MKAAGTASHVAVQSALQDEIGSGQGASPATHLHVAPSVRAPGRFGLLRYFSIASLIAIVLAVVGLGFFFRETALKQLVTVSEEHNTGLATAFANTLRPHYYPLIAAARTSSAAQLRGSPELDAVEAAMRQAVQQTAVVKVKIFDLNGRTLYSSEARQIGLDRSGHPGYTAARAGAVKSVLYQRETFDAFGKTITDRTLLGSYIPVRHAKTGELEAVLELYSDVTPYFEEIRRTQWKLRFGVAAVMLLLYGALFLIVRRADRLIRSQEAQRERHEETIRHLAHHDPLTGLPNRKLFAERLALTLARAKRNKRMTALLFVDLDGFKEINDTYGHSAGDRALQAAGRLLKGSLRSVDTVARMGGDEFTIALEDVTDAAHVATVAEKLRDAFAAPLTRENGVALTVTSSIGVALYPADGETMDALLNAADAAMYDAKAAGRNTYRFHKPAKTAAPA